MGFEIHAGHLVVGLDPVQPGPTQRALHCCNHTGHQAAPPNSPKKVPIKLSKSKKKKKRKKKKKKKSGFLMMTCVVRRHSTNVHAVLPGFMIIRRNV